MDSIKVVRLIHDVMTPTKAYPGDLGYDLYAGEDILLMPGEVTKVTTGLAIELPEGYGAIIKDRSSMASQGVLTSGGVIDNGYRGELIVLMRFCGPEFIDYYAIDKRQKIAQMILVPVVNFPIEEVDQLSETQRGTGGFGSTGA